MSPGETPYTALLCSNTSCSLRFPGPPGVPCPKCKSPTEVVGARVPNCARAFGKFLPLDVLIDNVRSVYNVGSVFRTADGAGIDTIHLCGISPTPHHSAMAKTSLGAEASVRWSQSNNAVDVARTLLGEGKTLWALESTENAHSLFRMAATRPREGLVLVIGNEVTGVDSEVLALCEHAVAIPMRGHKSSLNVATAFGIAAYALCSPHGPNN